MCKHDKVYAILSSPNIITKEIQSQLDLLSISAEMCILALSVWNVYHYCVCTSKPHKAEIFLNVAFEFEDFISKYVLRAICN